MFHRQIGHICPPLVNVGWLSQLPFVEIFTSLKINIGIDKLANKVQVKTNKVCQTFLSNAKQDFPIKTVRANMYSGGGQVPHIKPFTTLYNNTDNKITFNLTSTISIFKIEGK